MNAASKKSYSGRHFVTFATEALEGETVLVNVTGEIDISTGKAFEKALEDAAAQTRAKVIVSLDGCTYCDSSGLLALARARKALGSRLLVVVPAKSYLNRLFDLAGLLLEVRIVPTIEAATAA